jgi:hypothetical protein
MEVTQENVIQTIKFQSHATHLELCAFATVNHKQLIAEIHDLAGGMMSQ